MKSNLFVFSAGKCFLLTNGGGGRLVLSMFTGVTKSTELLIQLALPGLNSQILKDIF